jgi:hypothetical protein
MVQQITIRSRSGNMALAVFGLVDFLCALLVLFFFVVTSWGVDSLIDSALQLALAGAAFAGVFFLQIGTRNLGMRPRLTLRRN